MKIELDLTEEEIEKLLEATGSYQDEGPCPNGWGSDLLKQVDRKVEQAVNESRNGCRSI